MSSVWIEGKQGERCTEIWLVMDDVKVALGS